MPKKYYESEIVSWSYFKEDFLAWITWKKNTDSAEYRNIFNSILEFSNKNKVKYVLSDMRKEGLVQTEDLKWLEAEILGKAVEHGVLKIALVSEDTIFSNIYAETIKRKFRESPIEVGIFQDIASAKAWLLIEN
jgi:hypothetical protein